MFGMREEIKKSRHEDGMNMVKLGDIATYVNGYAFKPDDRGDYGLPIIRIQDLTGNTYDLGFYDGDYPKKIEINNGDILISWSASLGVYEWERGKALLNQHIFKVVFDKEVDVSKKYFVYAVKYKLEELSRKSHGATMKHVIKKDFDNTKIPFPSFVRQKEIAERLEKTSKIISGRKKQLQKLDELIQARFVEMFGDPITNSKLLPIEKIEERYFLKAGITTKAEDIHDYLKAGDRILDIGAGTGRYSVALSQEGYEVDAIELVKYNLGMLKAKKSNVKAYQGTALDLSRYQDETFDLTLLFGPMYHLFSYEDKLKALSEAKRVTKTGGVILVAYVMNDYSVLVHGFRDGHIKEALKSGKIDEHFQTQTNIDDLYSYVRIELINQLNQDLNLKRIKIIAADGPADYMRPILNKMDDETFELFMQYHLSTCERLDMIGASSHTLDILRKV